MKKVIFFMKYETLPKKVLVLWELLAVIVLLLLLKLTRVLLSPYTIWWYGVQWVLGALAVLTLFLYLPLMYISFRYIVLTEQIVLKGGVIFHKTHYLRRENISFISVYKNPLTDLLHLSSLMITAPGAKLFIPLMDHRRAMAIAKQLSYKNRFE